MTELQKYFDLPTCPMEDLEAFNELVAIIHRKNCRLEVMYNQEYDQVKVEILTLTDDMQELLIVGESIADTFVEAVCLAALECIGGF